MVLYLYTRTCVWDSDMKFYRYSDKTIITLGTYRLNNTDPILYVPSGFLFIKAINDVRNDNTGTLFMLHLSEITDADNKIITDYD